MVQFGKCFTEFAGRNPVLHLGQHQFREGDSHGSVTGDHVKDLVASATIVGSGGSVHDGWLVGWLVGWLGEACCLVWYAPILASGSEERKALSGIIGIICPIECNSLPHKELRSKSFCTPLSGVPGRYLVPVDLLYGTDFDPEGL